MKNNLVAITLTSIFFICHFATAVQINNTKKPSIHPISCLEELANVGELTIAPNPTSGDVKIEFVCVKNIKMEISILNTIGKKLDYFTVYKDFIIGKHSLTLKTSELPQGLYFVEFVSGESRYVQRLFVLGN